VNVLAIDPGKVCGRAWLIGGEFKSGESDRWAAVDRAHVGGGLFDLVVCESFVPRPGVRSWQPDALETIGALRYVCDRAGVPIETQAPADAKRFATNDKLAALGWRNPTRGGHADDAARHLLLAAVRHGLIDPARFAA
jgi:hypothetical protein